MPVLLSKRVTRDEEADWLAKKLVRIELGKETSVVAEVNGKVVGNSEVVRGNFDDDFAHGRLGIAIAKSYRGRPEMTGKKPPLSNPDVG